MSTVFRVERTGNFTVMSNTHLKDRRLSYKAKGLLSVILSLPPEWDYTVTGLACISADGVESVKTAVRELERYGYITRRQTRDERGRMSANEYLVYENPAENPEYIGEETLPEVNAPAYVEPRDEISCNEPDLPAVNAPAYNEPRDEKYSRAESNSASFSVAPSAGFTFADEPSTGSSFTATINKSNTKKSNKQKSNHSVNPASEDRTENAQILCSVSDWERCREVIRENIDYARYADDCGVCGDVDEMVTIMADVICGSSKTVRVNGTEMSREVVKNRFMKLTSDDIDYVLYALKNNAGAIKNIRAYLITALFNAYSTKGVYFSALAYRDMREGRI